MAVGLLAAGCGEQSDASADTTLVDVITTTTTPIPDILIAAVGDIAGSGSDDNATAKIIIEANPGALLTLGDNAYSSGSLTEYQTYYDPILGQLKAITYPTPGNHEYATPNAGGMRTYFGDRWPNEFYSFDLGSWHLISLDSEVDTSSTSVQVQWLRNDLAVTNQPCILAYWHSPRFSSGAKHGSDVSVEPLWRALYEAHADVVLSGHEHNYERFGKLDPVGQLDPNGIREFVIGTGGYDVRHYRFQSTPVTGSQLRIGPGVAGAGFFTLHSSGYDWKFQPIPGDSGIDSGSDTCH